MLIPPQVSIRILRNDVTFGRGHTCGGTLISIRTVLSAAHCFYNSDQEVRKPSELRVVAGTVNLNIASENGMFVTTVTKITIHEGYISTLFEHDLALLALRETIPSHFIYAEPISLRTVPVEEGVSCQISGWGKTYFVS